MPDHQFIDAVKLRINTLPTLNRLRRGKDGGRKCRAGCDVDVFSKAVSALTPLESSATTTWYRTWLPVLNPVVGA